MKQPKTNQSSGTRFVSRPDLQTDLNQQAQYHFRTQSGGQKNLISRPNQNQSFDFAYTTNNNTNSKNDQRYKSLSQKENNILDDFNEELNVNIISMTSQAKDNGSFNQSEQQLNYELHRILSKSVQGGNISLSVDDLSKIISSIENCMNESAQDLASKEEEIRMLRKELNMKDQQLHQQRSTLLSVQNEMQEQQHMRHLNVQSSPVNNRLAQLEQENEMLQIENKQAIKLAIHNRNKRGEKELGEYITRVKADQKSSVANNYSTILNAQFNRSLHERKNSTKGSINKSFNLF